jgi:hypothetical protein
MAMKSPILQQPALMSAVKSLGKKACLRHAPKFGGEMAKRLAGDGAFETTVEQALMRGLATA